MSAQAFGGLGMLAGTKLRSAVGRKANNVLGAFHYGDWVSIAD